MGTSQKNDTEEKNMKEHFLRCEVVEVIYLFPLRKPTPPSPATNFLLQFLPSLSAQTTLVSLAIPSDSFKWCLTSDLTIRFCVFTQRPTAQTCLWNGGIEVCFGFSLCVGKCGVRIKADLVFPRGQKRQDQKRVTRIWKLLLALGLTH